MSTVVIQNPILNSPFVEPERHFHFDDDGITNEIIEGRRVSSYFVPIAQSKKRGGKQQLAFETEWTQDRIEENRLVNLTRAWATSCAMGMTYLCSLGTNRSPLRYHVTQDGRCSWQWLRVVSFCSNCSIGVQEWPRYGVPYQRTSCPLVVIIGARFTGHEVRRYPAALQAGPHRCR